MPSLFSPIFLLLSTFAVALSMGVIDLPARYRSLVITKNTDKGEDFHSVGRPMLYSPSSIPSRFLQQNDNIRGGFVPSRFGVGDREVLSAAAVSSPPPPKRGLSMRDLRSVSNTTSGVAYSTGASCGYSASSKTTPSMGGG